MKIELDFKNQEEFIEFVSAFNNAMIAYYDIVYSIDFDCEISPKWDGLVPEKGKARLNLLTKQYKKLIKKEEEIND